MLSPGCSTRLTYCIARLPRPAHRRGRTLPFRRWDRNRRVRLSPVGGYGGAMDTLVLKVVATPLLILGARLASRRWGEIVGGWFVGLPLTSGPVCFFLALDH